jgi:hypothetical protein
MQVLHADGTRLRDAGASGVTNPYWIGFTAMTVRNEVKVYLVRRDNSTGPLL